MCDTYSPKDRNMCIALAKAQSRHPRGANRMRSVDITHAYKTIGLRPDSATHSFVILLNPVDGEVDKARLPVQYFGGRRAPASWGRAVAFIQELALRLLALARGA